MCMFSGTSERVYRPRKSVMTVDEVFTHIGGAENFHTREGMEQLRDAVPDYIWKYPKNKNFGDAYCTACGSTLEAERWKSPVKHNEKTDCPFCGKNVTFKHVAKGHAKVWDEFIFYEWQRSRLDDETIILTASHVWRNSRVPIPEEAPVNIAKCAIYVFEQGRAPMVYKRNMWNVRPITLDTFSRIERATPEENKFGGKPRDICETGRWRVNNCRTMRTYDELTRATGMYEDVPLTAIANISRWPWLEYLMRAGQATLAAQIAINGTGGKNVINTRGKTVREVLRLTEGQWYEVRKNGVKITQTDLKVLHAMEKMGVDKPKFADAKAVGGKVYTLTAMADEIPVLLRDTPEKLRKKALRRVVREISHGYEWRDYYTQLIQLGEDMTDEALILPKNVHMMHERMTERMNAIRIKEGIERRAEMVRGFVEERLPELRKRYTYNSRGLVLRPFETADEIINEGKTQHICIGSYAERYMQGQTVICCLRRAEEPDEPWRAVEFDARTGRLVQDRGYKNDRDGIDEGTKKLLALFWNDFNGRKTA